MKITNWKNALLLLWLGGDNLLDMKRNPDSSLCCELQDGKTFDIQGEDHQRIQKFSNITLIIKFLIHNGITYDIPLIKKLLEIDLSE